LSRSFSNVSERENGDEDDEDGDVIVCSFG